jgi:hypothetical protein
MYDSAFLSIEERLIMLFFMSRSLLVISPFKEGISVLRVREVFPARMRSAASQFSMSINSDRVSLLSECNFFERCDKY